MRFARSPLALAFQIEAREYENFRFTAATARTVTLFVIALCVGILLAALYNFYIRHVPGGVVRALLRAEALSEESAKTAKELGLSGKKMALWELKHGNALSRVVRAVGESEEDGQRKKRDGDTRYYIPEEEKYRAELRFDKEGNGVMGLAITAALAVGLAFLVIKLLPWFLGVIDGLL